MPAVLIVEDDAELREIIRIALTRRKFTVAEASNGKEAIAQFNPSATDVVITNIVMPEEDGLGVIMKLKAQKPQIKIIAMSGGGQASPRIYLDMAKVLGADATLVKPFHLSDLIEELDKILLQ